MLMFDQSAVYQGRHCVDVNERAATDICTIAHDDDTKERRKDERRT